MFLKKTFLLLNFLILTGLFGLGGGPMVSSALSSPLHEISIDTERGSQKWRVELASDDKSRARGLMFRREMPADAGMLFRFDGTQPVSMWMKNTFLALDMVFMSDTGRIASIHYGAVPQSLDIISSKGPVRYVLEINAGEARRSGLKPGQQMRHPWFASVD